MRGPKLLKESAGPLRLRVQLALSAERDGGSPSTAANDKPEPAVDDQISRETTTAEFVNFLPMYENGGVRNVQVLRNETLCSKYVSPQV